MPFDLRYMWIYYVDALACRLNRVRGPSKWVCGLRGVVAAVAVGIDPLANRVARERGDHVFGQSHPSA